ncbi:MAG: glycosyltransferase family 4 protein [Acidobacteria bacterium]|nr:glycosyltransferase family 4 protein [Acidobacteriota bacterium]MDA1235228.1 glycosyltransferase family 4 protein [Acidobacteriota bacterium]
MKILDVSPRVAVPLSSGSRVRIYNILSRLSRRHEVRQFSQTRLRDLKRPDFVREVRYTPSYREYRYKNLLGSGLCELMERHGFGAPVLCGYPLRLSSPQLLRQWIEWADTIIVEFPWQYSYVRSQAGAKPVVLAAHNVQAAKSRSGDKVGLTDRALIACTDRLERQAVLGADLILAVSPEDRQEFGRRYGAEADKIVVVPNGADIDQYQPTDETTRLALREQLGLPAGPLVIFPAPHRQAPILDGLKWVRRVAVLLPEVHFLITGAVRTSPVVEDNVTFTGFVDDYPPYLRAADCLLCPIALGGGTKLKLIEAAAAGLPIVAFAESVRGTRFRDGEHLLLAEKSAEDLAAKIRQVFDDRHSSALMGQAAHECAVQHYDWDAIVRAMEPALEALCRPSVGGFVGEASHT